MGMHFIIQMAIFGNTEIMSPYTKGRDAVTNVTIQLAAANRIRALITGLYMHM